MSQLFSKITRAFGLKVPIKRLLYESVAENRAAALIRPLEQKRSAYRCKDEFITLAQVQTWPEYFQAEQVYLDKSKHFLIVFK
jgi:hypothetical protein